MIIDNTIQNKISETLIAQNKERDANHKSSGKLSASMLGWPIQWMVLKNLGVEAAPFDEYVLRKFLRGKEVEDWLVGHIPGVISTQKFVEYQGAIGYVDALVDTKDFENKVGIIPHEIKSTTNAKFKMIEKSMAPDDPHALQAALYALALRASHFMVNYVASDDLRVLSFLVETKDYKNRVENIIKEYNEQMVKKEIPVFTPAYPWQKNKMYNNFPEWSELTAEEIKEKMDRLNIKFTS